MHKLKIGERTAAVLGWDGIWKGYPIDGVIVHEKPLRKYGHLLCVRPEEPRQRDGEEAAHGVRGERGQETDEESRDMMVHRKKHCKSNMI